MYFEENLVLIPLFMYKNFFKPLIGILLSFWIDGLLYPYDYYCYYN